MKHAHWVQQRLLPLSLGVSLLIATPVVAQPPAPSPPAPSPPTPSPPTPAPPAPTPPAPEPPAPSAKVVTDAVNVPVQVTTSIFGVPAVDTQQILHKSSEDVQTGDESAVRLLNNLTLNNVGLRVDLNATAWANTPTSSGDPTPSPSPSPSSSATASPSARAATSTGAGNGTGTGTTTLETPKLSSAFVHAALEGAAEVAVRLGPLNSEIVNVSGTGLASTAEIGGTCGSLTPTVKTALGQTSVRILGHNIALPENPEPNTEVPLTDIPGLVSGTLFVNEQTTFGDGSSSQIVAVAPLRLQLRLSLAGLGGLADVGISLGGNSVAVDCGTSSAPSPEPPPTTPPPTEPPTAPPTTPPPTTPIAPPPMTPTTTPSPTSQPSAPSVPSAPSGPSGP